VTPAAEQAPPGGPPPAPGYRTDSGRVPSPIRGFGRLTATPSRRALLVAVLAVLVLLLAAFAGGLYGYAHRDRGSAAPGPPLSPPAVLAQLV